MQNQKSLLYRELLFSGWGIELVSLGFDYKGGQYIRKDNDEPMSVLVISSTTSG